MIHIQEQRPSRLIRWYSSGSYEEQSRYSAVVSLVYESETEVLLEGLCGNINRQFWKDVADLLFRENIKSAIIYRHGKRRTLLTEDFINAAN